jgi:predicted transcriptional regulator
MVNEMDELIGFVLGNRHRERILQLLGSKGEMKAEKIAKIEHLPAPHVQKILSDLSDKKLVALNNDIWSRTELGADVEKGLKRRT